MQLQEHKGDETGIFRKVTWTGQWSEGDGPGALMALLAKAHELTKETFDLEGNLAQVEQRAMQVLASYGLTFPWAPDKEAMTNDEFADYVARYNEARKAGPPILHDAHRLLFEIRTARQDMASLDETQRRFYMKGAMRGFRIGAKFKQMAVRPFEPLVKKGRRLISWYGRTCDVTRREHVILSCTLGRHEITLQRVVKHAWKETYNPAHRTKYDTTFNRLNQRLVNSGIPISFHVRGAKLIREQLLAP